MHKKTNLFGLTKEQMIDFFLSLEEKPYRARQVMTWIYHKGCDSFEQMTDLNKNLRDKLCSLATLDIPKITDIHCSKDGTVKWILQVDKQQIETVYIPQDNRATLCISSQVGCLLDCKFCSTAKQGFNRNLKVEEIIGQLVIASRHFGPFGKTKQRPFTNVVFMGMGEPLLNFNNVVSAARIISDDFGFGIAKRRLTISTSGVVPALERLKDTIDVALAVSLHAPNDELRDQIVPINRKYDIKTLLKAVHEYVKDSKANQGKATIEYVMLHKVNDTEEHARQLAKCLSNLPCKINLIPWNPFPNAPFETSSKDSIEKFHKILVSKGYVTTVRKTRGDDIQAACGQLVGQVRNRVRKNPYSNLRVINAQA